MEIRTIDLEGRTLRIGIRRGRNAGPPLLLFNGIGVNLELIARASEVAPVIRRFLQQEAH